MSATAVQVTFDCADPGAQAEFWAAALGYVVQPPPSPFGSWEEALETWGVPSELIIVMADPEGNEFCLD